MMKKIKKIYNILKFRNINTGNALLNLIVRKIFTEYSFYKSFFEIKKKREIFKKEINKKQNKAVFFSLPRSGFHWLEVILNSYYEKLYELSNGEIKFSKLDGKFISPINELKVFNLEKFSNLNNKFTFDKRYNFIYSAGHYPIDQNLDINFNNIKPIIITRNPVDACFSWVCRDIKTNRFKQDILNESNIIKNIDLRAEQIKKFFFYWLVKKKNNNFMHVKFKELTENPIMEIIKILSYSKININENYLKEIIPNNDYDNFKKKILSQNELFYSADESILNKDLVKKKIEELFVNELREYLND